MNPNDSKDRGSLFSAIKHHYKELAPFRVNRVRLIKDYAGSLYGGMQPGAKTLVNLIKQTADAYTLALASNRPRFLVTAKQTRHEAFGERFATALNNLIQEIHFEETMQDVTLDAFFGLGIVKTYLADAPLVEIEDDIWMDPGRPFAGRISFDNFVYDTGVADFRKVQLASDRYRVPYESLRDSDRFDQKVARKLSPSSKQSHDPESETAQAIAAGNETDKGEIEPMIDLMDVWLPRDRRIVTWACDQKFVGIDTDPLAVQEDWDGPETGCYDVLNLGPVPDNIMPTSPAENLKALSDLLNSLMRKQRNQAKAQKTVNFYQGDNANEARRAKKAVDNEWIRSSNPAGFAQLKLGGVDQVNLAFSMSLMDMFDRMAGNLKAAAGLGPQSGTAAQDSMIMGQVSRAEEGLRYKTNRFAVRVGRAIGFMMFDDPVMTIPGQLKVEGLPHYPPLQNDWVPEEREGVASDYDLNIEPLSMAFKPAAAQAAELRQTVNEMIQLLPIMEQQGVSFDGHEYIRQLAELTAQPRLTQIFKSLAPMAGGMGGEEGGKPANTTRTYRRENVPTGGTQESRNDTLMRQLLPGNSSANNDQEAALTR